MKPKPKQASPVSFAQSIPTQKPIGPLYSLGGRMIVNMVILLGAFVVSFNITRSVVWHVTGYIPPVRCGSIAYEFQRQVAEGAMGWNTIGDSNAITR
jgi:hypothetical protein